MVSDNTENTGNNAEPPNSTAMWNQDGGGGAETEIVDGGPETEVVDSAPRQIETPPAWSEAEDYPELPAPRSWRGTAVRAGAILSAAIVVAGGVWAWDHLHNKTPRKAPAPAAAANGPVLDGIYEIASDNQHATVNGESYSGTDVTRYWAFRSLCTPARCVATAGEVSDTNHQVANYDHDHSIWLWTDGTWNEDPDHNTDKCGNGPPVTATMVRTLAPQPDGTLKGTETDVVDKDSPCNAGVVVQHPITAKRIGDTPEGVVADPATAPSDVGVHANQYVAIAVPRGANQKTAYPAAGPTDYYADQIAVTQCRNHAGADADCAVVETNLNGCVAFALNPSGDFAGGKGPTPDAARGDARANLTTSYWVSEPVCSR